MNYIIAYKNKKDTYLGEITLTGMRTPVTLELNKPTEDISKAIKLESEEFADSLLKFLGESFEKVEVSE